MVCKIPLFVESRPTHQLDTKPVDVLVIDDTPSLGEALVEALGRAGLTARVTSPAEAVEAALHGKGRLLVVDLDLTELRADRLLALLRSVDRLADVKLVLASSEDSVTLDRVAKTAGADGVYRKAQGHEVLVRLVEELLDSPQASGVRRRR